MFKILILHGFSILFLSHALAVEDVTSCNILLQFPVPKHRQAEIELLPSYFHNRPLSAGLKHITRLAKQGTQKRSINPATVDGDNDITYLIALENFDARELRATNLVSSDEVLKLPYDLISTQEIQDLRPEIRRLGFEQIIDRSYEIPILITYPIPRIKIEGYIHTLAATPEGHPVMLVNLPSGRDNGELNDRANDTFILAGLKILSDQKVFPELLGVTKVDGVFKGVFPIPAGYKNLDVRMVLVGFEIARGIRGKNGEESFDQEFTRIQNFENLIQRLLDSQWPMVYQSLDLSEEIEKHPDLDLNAAVNFLKMPLWENSENVDEEPFLFPNYFDSNSTWLPKVFKNKIRVVRQSLLSTSVNQPKTSTINAQVKHFESQPVTNEFVVTTMSKNKSLPLKERLIPLNLQSVDPLSTFGRITLLRLDFFLSILNKKAKMEYLDFIYEKSPEEHKALAELVKFLAVPLKIEAIQTFITNYQASKVRKTFQVIDKSGN